MRLRRLRAVAARCAEARSHFEHARASYLQCGAPQGEAHAWVGLGDLSGVEGGRYAARTLYEQAHERYEAIGDHGGLVRGAIRLEVWTPAG